MSRRVFPFAASSFPSAIFPAYRFQSSSPSTQNNNNNNNRLSSDQGAGQRSVWAYGTSRPTPATKEPWDSLQGLLIGVRPRHPRSVFDDHPVGIGRLVKKFSDTLYLVRFKAPPLRANGGPLQPTDTTAPLTLDVGTRVTIRYDDGDAAAAASPGSSYFIPEDASVAGMYLRGTIAKVNGNATYTMLMENDEVELSVSPLRIVSRAPAKKFLHSARFLDLVGWLRSCIHDPRDCEAVAFILFSRGWRVEKMYLLEKADLAHMVFVSPIERESVHEKAQWELDHYNVVRGVMRERVKDRDFRYALAKYKGTISCISGVFVVTYVFTANLRAYRRQQRGHQVKVAVRALSEGLVGSNNMVGEVGTVHHPHNNNNNTNKNNKNKKNTPMIVRREAQERLVRSVLNTAVTSHSRIAVLTGSSGCGKSVVCRSVVMQENLPAVYVDIRGGEDTLRSVVKALGVHNVEVCGDLLDFVAEACREAKLANDGCTPAIIIKLREGGSLEKVYREAVGLVGDYQACHLILEAPMEMLTSANVALPKLDFYHIPPFTRPQAFQYLQHLLDPLDVSYFVDVVGTNSNDLDELFAAVRQRGVDPVAYTGLKLIKAMRRLQGALGPDEHAPVRQALYHLARQSFVDGLLDESVEHTSALHHPLLREFVLHDPVTDQWRFTRQVFHTAARCIWSTQGIPGVVEEEEDLRGGWAW